MFKVGYLFLLCLSSTAIIADEAKDLCAPVLEYAKEIHTEKNSSSKLLDLYNNYCQGDKRKESSSFGVGLDTEIYSIPIKFNLNSGSKKDKENYFCKTFSSSSKEEQNYSKYTVKASPVAISAWLQCRKMHKEGILFKPSLVGTTLGIEVKNLRAKKAEITGILFNKELLSCTVANTDTEKNRVEASKDIFKTLADETIWSVSCDRKKINEKDKGVIIATYPETVITVVTTKGNFTLSIPSKARYPYEWVGSIDEKFEKISKRIKNLKKESADIRILLSSARIYDAFTSGVADINNSTTVTATFCSIARVVTIHNGSSHKTSGCDMTFSGGTWTLKGEYSNGHTGASCKMVCFGVK